MHLIPRRAARRVLVLLIAMGAPPRGSRICLRALRSEPDQGRSTGRRPPPAICSTYTLVIQQHGTHPNAPGTVTDTLPAHTTYVSARRAAPRAGALITCPIGPVAGGPDRHDHDHRARRRRRAGRRPLLNIADVTTPGDTHHRQQPRLGHHGRELRGPRRLRLVGSEPRRPAGRRRARPRRRDAAHLRRLRRAHRHDEDGRLGSLPLRPAAAGDDLLRLHRRRRQRAGRPARGLRADDPERRAATTRSTPTPCSLNGTPCIIPATTGPASSFVPTYDFGFWKPGALGDYVWNDLNHNGIQDAGEPAVGGVGVELHDATGATIATTTTDASGLYLFDRLNPGNYKVCFVPTTIPPGYVFTTKDAPGSTRANGSDAERDGCTDTISLAAGPARSGLGRRHLEDAASPSTVAAAARLGPTALRQAQAGAEEDRQAGDGSRRRRRCTTR